MISTDDRLPGGVTSGAISGGNGVGVTPDQFGGNHFGMSSPANQQSQIQQQQAATNNVLSKCVCGWKNCRAYQKAFRDAKHPVWDGVIKLKFATDHAESMALKNSIDRNLRVPRERSEDWKQGKRSDQKICRYTIARHHWTEKHVQKYLADPKNYSFLKPFSIHGAKKYLHTVDATETVGESAEQETLYLQCPNVPKEVVKAEFMRVKEMLDSKQHQQQSSNSAKPASASPPIATASSGPTSTSRDQPHHNQQQQQTKRSASAYHHTAKTKPSNSSSPQAQARGSGRNQGSGSTGSMNAAGVYKKDSSTASTTRSQSVSGNSQHQHFHQQQQQHIDQTTAMALRQKEDENRLLKDQLESMKSQLTFLHDMVRRLQEEHFDHVSVRSRQSRHFSSGGTVTGGYNNNSTSNSHKRVGASSMGGGRSTRSARSGVPEEIELGEDGAHGVGSIRGGRSTGGYGVDDWNENTEAEEWTDQDQFDDDDEEPTDTQDGEDDETSATFQVTYQAARRNSNGSRASRASKGASTIVSASKSVKTLPREIELDEDEDDSDTHESLEDEAFDSRSFASNYDGTGTVDESRASAAGPSSTITGGSRRRSVGPSNKKPNRRTSLGAASSTSYHSQKSTKSSRSGRASGVIGVSDATGSDRDGGGNQDGGEGNAGTYHVQAMMVTDPYGEQGTYTGTISNATGMPHGRGRLEYDRAGRWYEGDWKHGRWTGQGHLSNGDGDFYEGGLKNDHKHGYGRMIFADGRTFEGEYVNGQMIEGKMTYQDGSIYEGSWVDGMRHGHGRCVFTDQSVYEGEFREGEFFGHGKMTWSDGGHYVGEWWNGEMHGRGKEVRPDGSLRHEGQWSKGQPIRR